MKQIILLILFGFLSLSIFSPSHGTKLFEVDESDLRAYSNARHYQKMISEGQESIRLFCNLESNDSIRQKARKNIEQLAIEGEPISIAWLWKLRERKKAPQEEIQERAKFVRDFLICAVDVLAFGEIGDHIRKYSLNEPTFLPTVRSFIEEEAEPSSLRAKLNFALSLGYMVANLEDPTKNHSSLLTAWDLLKEFEVCPEAQSKIAKKRKYVQRAYAILFDHALSCDFKSLFDQYISSLLKTEEDSPLLKQGVPSLYRVLNEKNASYLSFLKENYDIDFKVTVRKK